MKYLIVLLMLLSANLFAGDSGLYEDATKTGEGILIQRNKDTVVTYFFTFGGYGCKDYSAPSVGPVPFVEYDCDIQADRWFYAANEFNEKTQEVSGFLYKATGTNWPLGIPADDDPFVNEVSKSMVVGIYILRRHDEGFRFFVQRFGMVLDEFDPIFERVFNFTQPVFFVDEDLAEPK